MNLPINQLHSIVRFLDAVSEWVGRFVSWLVLLMVIIICYDVTMRYVFLQGSVALQELEWHLFAFLFLLGAGYTFKHDDHVRVDVLYRSKFITTRHRNWINLLGGLFLLMPFCILVIVSSWPFVYSAYQFSEGSPDPGGLPYRYLIKATIPVGFTLLLLQGIASILRNLLAIIHNDHTEAG
jgi:TRAP-type mannitol/chloroaromatic compound transport system permease small subunit